jgi:hypothetical protein
MTIRPLPVTAAAAVLVLTGLAHGLRTDRWGVGREVAAAAARLEKVPRAAGDWKGTDTPTDLRALRIAQVAGDVSREFKHQVTFHKANVLLLCGRPGAIGSHTPEICFAGLGFEMEDLRPVRQPVRCLGDPSAAFWTASFVRPGPPREHLRVWWAWGVAGEWRAVEEPRLVFAGQPALYKLYVTSPVRGPDQKPTDDPALKLIEALLPELRTALSP